MKNIFRPLVMVCALTMTLSACSSGTDAGDTNVENGHDKRRPTIGTDTDGAKRGDSTTAGIPRDTTTRPTGKELYKAAADAKDRNHDGLAD